MNYFVNDREVSELDFNDSDIIINELNNAILNVYKLSLEDMGYDLNYNKAQIEYRNYWVADNNVGALFGDSMLDGGDFMGTINYDGTATPMISSGQTKENALQVISALMSKLGLTKEQAAGIAGVLTAESGVNPAIYNKGEKNGTYKSSGANNTGAPYGEKHCPWSYGAGICQWTFTQRKEKAIMGGLGVSREEAVNIIKSGGIESLSLDKQINMLAYELEKGDYKNTLAGIKKCSTASQSAATFYCHAVAGYSTSREPASDGEVNKANARYAKVGATSQITKGMRFAEGYIK